MPDYLTQFKKRERVQLKRSKRYGTILDEGNHSDRYLVEFDDGEQLIILEENLKRIESMTQFKEGDIVQVVGREWSILNGKKGRVVLENGDEPTVEFDNPYRRVDIHKRNLKKIEPMKFQIQERVESQITGRTGTIIDIQIQENPVQQKIIFVQWDGDGTLPDIEGNLKKLYNMKEQEMVTTTRENIIRAYERADEKGKETLRELYPETIGNAFPDLVKMPESITNCIDDPVMIGCSWAPKEMEEHCLLLKKGWGTWKLEQHPENSNLLILYCEKK